MGAAIGACRRAFGQGADRRHSLERLWRRRVGVEELRDSRNDLRQRERLCDENTVRHAVGGPVHARVTSDVDDGHRGVQLASAPGHIPTGDPASQANVSHNRGENLIWIVKHLERFLGTGGELRAVAAIFERGLERDADHRLVVDDQQLERLHFGDPPRPDCRHVDNPAGPLLFRTAAATESPGFRLTRARPILHSPYPAGPTEGAAGLEGASADHRVKDEQHDDGAHGGDKDAVEVDAGDAGMAQHVEDEAADDRANDTEHDVHDEAFAAPVDDHASDPAGDEADHEPGDYGHLDVPSFLAALYCAARYD